MKASGTLGGFVSIYWRDGQSWEVVTEGMNNGEVTVSAKIENASGPMVIFLKNSSAWASSSQAKEIDIYSSSDEQIDAPVLTWLGRPRDPKIGEVILVSNIASRGERIRLEYNGTGWALPWGAIISGTTTNEARQSYTAAIISRMINPHDITVAT
ncbi:MAG: hypothetical protein Q4A61_00895 [Porphyromonadaceae bacterium]|nr:hypothetical protein [Porphyromonadaceae bacterium]